MGGEPVKTVMCRRSLEVCWLEHIQISVKAFNVSDDVGKVDKSCRICLLISRSLQRVHGHIKIGSSSTHFVTMRCWTTCCISLNRCGVWCKG